MLCALVAYALDSRDTLAAAEAATLLAINQAKHHGTNSQQESPTENNLSWPKLAGLHEMAKEATPSGIYRCRYYSLRLESFLESQGRPGFRSPLSIPFVPLLVVMKIPASK